MPKTVLLLRHAKSSWNDPDLADHDRPLNSRGKRDAPLIGQLLCAEGLRPDVIISSTAKRARKTAKAVAVGCRFDGEVQLTDDLYLAPAQIYLDFLRQLSAAVERALLIGHNPGIEYALRLLSGADQAMPTAALAQIELPVDDWSILEGTLPGRLVRLWRPRDLDA